MQVYGKYAWQSTLVAVLPAARSTLANSTKLNLAKALCQGGWQTPGKSHSGTLAKGAPQSIVSHTLDTSILEFIDQGIIADNELRPHSSATSACSPMKPASHPY
jgi:hypothetical protein